MMRKEKKGQRHEGISFAGLMIITCADIWERRKKKQALNFFSFFFNFFWATPLALLCICAAVCTHGRHYSAELGLLASSYLYSSHR
jgi:hypothetical protein